MPRVAPQLLVFSYHKTGTSLFLHVMTRVCERLGLSLETRFGLVTDLRPDTDVVLLPHSMLRCEVDWPCRAIRMIRDPRDIWVSGYLYHRHCEEEWCTSTDFDPTPPIGWPRVDYAFVHRPEAWKRGWLDLLGGRSYQQNLLDRSLEDGLDFELAGYTGGTLETMREWKLNGIAAIDVRLEDVTGDFDATMTRIFAHFGFVGEQRAAALEEARSEDVNRMDDAAMARRPQIHSRVISKWRDVLPAAHLARFEAEYGDLIRQLGYDPAGESVNGLGCDDALTLADVGFLAAEADAARLVWPASRIATGPMPARAPTRRPVGVWLLADASAIAPMAERDGVLTFVVPANTRHVRLESDASVAVDPALPYLGSGRARGVKVSAIEIRSRSGERVIAADDPALAAGWHEAGQDGWAVWRWTDGSASVPWDGVAGPAVVTVRCVAGGGN